MRSTMTYIKPTQPIGIFDSGIGGLTVAQAIVKQLPKENIIYFGDTAHLPYGDKSASTIQSYSVKIAHMLLQQPCKMIVIACNSASAAAYELIKASIGQNITVINVIDPMIHHLSLHYANKHLGLIATRHTIHSKIFNKKIDELNRGITLASLPTGFLASAIEEFGNHKIIDHLLDEYLSHHSLKDIRALILACTHYPVIKHKIDNFFKHQIDIIDSSEIVAKAVKQHLEKDNLLNINGEGKKEFYVSDYTESFAAGTKLFFGEDIPLKHYPLWE